MKKQAHAERPKSQVGRAEAPPYKPTRSGQEIGGPFEACRWEPELLIAVTVRDRRRRGEANGERGLVCTHVELYVISFIGSI